jgi:hypothetical protein
MYRTGKPTETESRLWLPVIKGRDAREEWLKEYKASF